MRAGFGLVGILIAIGVLVYFLGPGGGLAHQKAVIDAGGKASQQVNQFAGNSADGGMKFNESVTLDLQDKGGKPDSILITGITPGGPADTYYGLQRGDSVVEVMQMPVRGHPMVSSTEDGMIALQDSYQRKTPIKVIRNGKEIVLPIPPIKTPVPTGSSPAAPGATSNQPIPSH